MDPASSSSLSSMRKWHSDSSIDEPYCKKPKNDVFLNYSFEDIGNSFIRHLKAALDRNSYTISDHTMVPVGQNVCLELLKAIHESEIFVVVFSRNYASSVRCLDELVDIMDCLPKFDDRKVFPIFYKVEPSDVRSQQGPFMEAFHAHETNVNQETVQTWKKALKETGLLSGVTLQNGDEAEFLLKIVEQLAMIRSPEVLHVTDHPVGIESRTEELISTLRLDYKDHVLVVGVSGISGIGKTTIVKAGYNRIAAKFNIRCFLPDIHDRCQVPSWKVDLPKELISCLTRNHKFSIMGDHSDYVTQIKRLVSHQKALLVLDDVDNFQQLEALGINPAWFYKGSRIIITTRDKRSFGDIPYTSYVTRFLNRRESFNFFTQLMVATVNTKFIEEVVSHAGGIPLVLKVWSRHFNRCEREDFPSELEKLKRIPHGDVHEKLKMSYDSLTNRAKTLFLDLACFFVDQLSYFTSICSVVEVLQDEERAFFPDKEFRYLVDRSLVEKTTGYYEWSMPWAIREMAKEIVRQENEDEPGQRTRLWMKSDVMRVLTKCSGTESVESIHLVTREDDEDVIVQVEALRKMRNLRLLCITCNYSYVIKPTRCPLFWSGSSRDEMASPLSFHKLQYLRWSGFPFKSINHIDMANVVVLRLDSSNLEILWEGMKNLKKLRVLDVRDSKRLTKTGDFYGVENLEELIFFGCSNLKELHGSIGCLRKLAILNLSHCGKLKKIPWEMIVKLSSLRELILPDTDEEMHPFLSSLKEPLSLLQLHKLNKIEANFCINLASLPWNMSELKSLTVLNFSCCPKLGSEDPQFLMKVTGLTNLTQLTMRDCNVSQVPAEIGNLVSLKTLKLSGNTFCSLPDSLSNLSQLVDLYISRCSELQLLPLLPSNLKSIRAEGCGSLRIMPFDPMQTSYSFRSKAFKESTFCKPLVIYLGLNHKEIPGLFSYRNRGNTLSFVAPMNLDKKICGIILYTQGEMDVAIKIFNKTKNKSRCLEEMKLVSNMQIMFYPLDDTTLVVEAGDTVKLKFTGYLGSRGLRLIYDSDVVDSKLLLQPLNDIPYEANDFNLYYDSDSHSDDDDDDDDDDELQ